MKRYGWPPRRILWIYVAVGALWSILGGLSWIFNRGDWLENYLFSGLGVLMLAISLFSLGRLKHPSQAAIEKAKRALD